MYRIAMVMSGQEFGLRDELRRRGYESWMPTTRRKVRIRGRCTKRVVPAWPGYLLIPEPAPIVRDSRFFCYLHVGDELSRLKDEIVEVFREMERQGRFQAREDSSRVTVAHGQ
jgi:hypothetical protein